MRSSFVMMPQVGSKATAGVLLGVWSSCFEVNLKYRSRGIGQNVSTGGLTCNMSLEEVSACNQAIDCTVSAWSDWDVCDSSCGGGQTQRHRSVTQNPLFDGRPCPPDLVETAGCGDAACKGLGNCIVGDWSAWSMCSSSCGAGQQRSFRTILELPKPGGLGCTNDLAATRVCQLTPCEVDDCSWGDWSDWSLCSSSCDGGQASRTRSIDRLPSVGGQPCAPSSRDQIKPCQTRPCNLEACVDGVWSAWDDWVPCSATCAGGSTWRTRNVAVDANHCGTPPIGPNRVSAPCNTQVKCEANVDCLLSEWDSWGECSQSCSGTKKRTRQISRQGRGHGNEMPGHMW